MKKHYFTFVGLLSLLFVFSSHGQSIINGGFETWTNTSHEELNNWHTSAAESLRKFGVSNAAKVTDKVSGVFALKLETKANATDTSLGYFANGDPMNHQGQGEPFSQTVTHIKGYYKNAMVGTDVGILWLIFKKAGVVIQDTMFLFPGAMPNYTPFIHDLKLTQSYDTVVVAGASSDPFMGNLKNGSWIQFDSLTFDNNGTKIAILNGNFEDWINIVGEEPFSWDNRNADLVDLGSSAHAEKTTDKTAGVLALKLTTRYADNNFTTAITSGYFTQNGDKGGDPYAGGIKDTVIGYYKYFPQGSDSGSISVNLTKLGISLSNNGKSLPPTGNSYVYFEVPFLTVQPADTIRVYLSSSNWPVNMNNVGSELYIDGLMLKSELMTSVKENHIPFKNPLYPNPATDYVTADISLKNTSDVSISVFDITGKVVYRNNHSNLPSGKNQFKLNTSDFKPGVYIYELKAGEQVETSRFTVK